MVRIFAGRPAGPLPSAGPPPLIGFDLLLDGGSAARQRERHVQLV
jgi:hypothetical protein